MEEAARFVRSLTAAKPTLGVVLGSGLGEFANALANAVHISYSQLPRMPLPTAIGHAGELVIGNISDASDVPAQVAVLSGRVHLYEGYSAQQITSGIRLLRRLGVEKVVLTNAAGGINPAYSQGALVLISDHINLQAANPLAGSNDENLGPRFPDMTDAYSADLRKLAKQTAQQLDIELQEGIYAGVLGPSYETPAEIRYLRAIGADLVGMSTIAETIAANHLGMSVVGISCVTNLAAGLSGQKLIHDDVIATGRRVSETLLRLLRELIPRLAEHPEHPAIEL